MQYLIFQIYLDILLLYIILMLGVLHLVYSNFQEYVLRTKAEKRMSAFHALKDWNFLSRYLSKLEILKKCLMFSNNK